MKTLFILSNTHNGFYYAFFYYAAFLIAAGIFIYQGLRNHYAPRTWLIITLSGMLTGIFGNKFVTLDAAGWAQIFQGGGLPESGRSVLGLIPGLIVGVELAKRWLRFHQPVLDHLAYALPAGMAVTRLGCLLGGCCYGIPTHLPWAIQYGPASRAFEFHVNHLHIPSFSTLSRPVHPTQVYEILCCLLIIYLVWLTRKYWKAPENKFVYVITWYVSFRFALEFLRQSPGDELIFEHFLGIKILQWILIGAILLLVLIIIVRERIANDYDFISCKIHPVSLKREFLLFTAVILMAILIIDLLAPFEKMIILVFTIPVLLHFIWVFYIKLTVAGLRWKVPLILVLAGVSLGQASLDHGAGKDLNKNRGWLSTDVFGGFGSYPDNVYDCYGKLEKTMQRNYSTWGAGITYHYKPRTERYLKTSLNLYSSRDWSKEPDEFDFRSPALNTMISYNTKNVGATLGLNVFFNTHWISDIVPAGELWAGSRDVLFIETRLLTDYHYLGPPGLFQVGLGSGFGKLDKNLGRFGLSMMYASYGFLDGKIYVMGVYLGSDILVKDKMTIRGNLFIGKYIGASVGAQLHYGKNRWFAVRE